MNSNRRKFIKASLGSMALGAIAHSQSKTRGELSGKLDRIMDAPVLKTEFFPEPVRIATIDLLKNGAEFLIRVRAENGATGIAVGHGPVLESAWPILLKRIAPYFIGKDARKLESLLEGVYLIDSNYKWQGLPFWVCVASLEFAVLDLLGKVADKPLGELFGNIVRRDVAVYRASGNRGNSPEAEIQYLQKLVAETGAKAIKFRLGARMRYDEASTKRDLALIPLTRKTFGGEMALHADANGSYDVPMAIKIGRLLEVQKFAFFEEPVPFDYYDETKRIADALTIPIALGEQESSLRNFRRIIETNTAQIVQPDLFYFGGMIRSIKVARMSEAAGTDCTPHMSGGGLGWLYVAHFASCVPNAGPFQEFKGENEDLPVSSKTSSLKCEKGMLRVPSEPGLGVTIDPDFVRKAVTVQI
ncbi:MAG: mandelate racemase/muconate lactonizing enzyme family protein [Blastocatellales bacterium]